MSYPWPDYIYEPKTGYIRCEKNKSYFLDSSEYGTDKYKKFRDYDSAKKYISEQNFSGSLGIKLN